MLNRAERLASALAAIGYITGRTTEAQQQPVPNYPGWTLSRSKRPAAGLPPFRGEQNAEILAELRLDPTWSTTCTTGASPSPSPEPQRLDHE